MVEGIVIGLGVAVFPAIVGLFLPRKTTIAYGGKVYKLLGEFLAKQGKKITDDTKKVSKIIKCITSTLVDFAYGIYLASLDISDAEKANRIEGHLNDH